MVKLVIHVAKADGVPSICITTVTNAAGVQGLSGPNPFTISDLSTGWIICDVYENDMDAVRVGETADIHLNAYPNKVLKARIATNILPTMDPTIRTAKVRLEVANTGILRIGIFTTATFYGRQAETRAVVPATAILHIHDRNGVLVPAGNVGCCISDFCVPFESCSPFLFLSCCSASIRATRACISASCCASTFTSGVIAEVFADMLPGMPTSDVCFVWQSVVA